MTEDELRDLKSNKLIDARGTSCPGPLLAVKRSIVEVPVKEIMEILSSDVGTKRDIPKWSEKMGHEYLGDIEEAGYWRIFLRRMK